jgi:hypothetical protein
VSVLQHASAHKWGKVQGQYPCMRFGAAGSNSGAVNAVSLFNSRTSYLFHWNLCNKELQQLWALNKKLNRVTRKIPRKAFQFPFVHPTKHPQKKKLSLDLTILICVIQLTVHSFYKTDKFVALLKV